MLVYFVRGSYDPKYHHDWITHPLLKRNKTGIVFFFSVMCLHFTNGSLSVPQGALPPPTPWVPPPSNSSQQPLPPPPGSPGKARAAAPRYTSGPCAPVGVPISASLPGGLAVSAVVPPPPDPPLPPHYPPLSVLPFPCRDCNPFGVNDRSPAGPLIIIDRRQVSGSHVCCLFPHTRIFLQSAPVYDCTFCRKRFAGLNWPHSYFPSQNEAHQRSFALIDCLICWLADLKIDDCLVSI